MLHSLKLQNFRKHEDLVVTFGPGLNAIKGANEAGKSTIIYGAVYALFGAKALPLPLSEFVTWGKKENELKVSLTLSINGRMYNFTRSKSGAEVNYDGGTVTGQNEVSNFAAEILGGDRDLIGNLMLANQAGLRGALEEGPKAVSQMIENLANFTLFDRIILAASHKLTTGPTTTLENRVVEMTRDLEASTPPLPDFSEYDQRIAEERTAIDYHNGEIELITPLKAEAESAYSNAQTRQRMKDNVESNLKRAIDNLNLHIQQKADADAKAVTTVTEEQIEAAKAEYRACNDAANRAHVYASFTALNKTYPDMYWEGDKASFLKSLGEERARLDEIRDELNGFRLRIKELDGQITLNQSKLVTGGVCPTCGTDTSKNEKVIKQNAETEALIDTLKDEKLGLHARCAGWETLLSTKRGEVTELEALGTGSTPFENFAARHGEYVEVDTEYYPPRLNWKGSVPSGDLPNEKELKDRVVSLQGAKEAAERANARSIALAETTKEDREYIARLELQLLEVGEVGDVEKLHETARRFGNQIATHQSSIYTARGAIEELERNKIIIETTYRNAMQARASAEARLAETKKELDTLNFNNNLLKKIRAARPLIADKLWSMTLTAVSTMFSTMRGEKSVVTKDKDGFSVNGKPVEGLSGSTLDILGLAIRVALIKTFIPHVSFLILDEPASGCDSNRTSSLLGFVSASGFDQTVVVSHEEATEAAADHLIQL